MGRDAPSEAYVRFCQDAVTMVGGPERHVLGWLMRRPTKAGLQSGKSYGEERC